MHDVQHNNIFRRVSFAIGRPAQDNSAFSNDLEAFTQLKQRDQRTIRQYSPAARTLFSVPTGNSIFSASANRRDNLLSFGSSTSKYMFILVPGGWATLGWSGILYTGGSLSSRRGISTSSEPGGSVARTPGRDICYTKKL